MNRNLEEKELIERMEALGIPGSKACLVASMLTSKGFTEGFWSAWVTCVDESDYGWGEWVESLLLLEKKIVASSDENTSAENLIGYINCSAEGARSSQYMEPLPEIVSDAFEAYGFESV